MRSDEERRRCTAKIALTKTNGQRRPVASRSRVYCCLGMRTDRSRTTLRSRRSITPRMARFRRLLARWYARHRRDLPWRRTSDPYAILVSELMLQQTPVARVVPYYTSFLDTFPTLEALAGSEPARVMESWRGLGYYARARNLHRLARAVVDDRSDDSAGNATLPSDPKALERLPGVGRYTAGAVASFGFGRRAALVDTNVARVLRRVFGVRGRGQAAVWSFADALLPRTGRSCYTHNQALMELGALICTARVRHCTRCPVRSLCATYARER